ncbi:MAG: L-serine ammonia-lyase, iron-sulfur-dependent, subunit alpha [Anaerovoracaceae bacterium]|jgi:L-serine dehydratase
MLKYQTVLELVDAANAENTAISEIVIRDQADEMEKSRSELYDTMARDYKIMKESAEEGSSAGIRSTSGLTGGDAYLLKQAAESGKSLCGGLFSKAIAKAVAVAEFNASMGRIVAAPTAGSCGIMPGTLIAYQEEYGAPDETVVMSMFTAAAFGMVINNKACLAGAGGGCQAECGSASAMAAAALTECAGGTPEMAADAAAIALKNILGLVCDPVAGLVEIPCIKRNAGCTANALCAAEMALAGVKSRIPADDVILAMKHIGDSLPAALKETALGGLAATPAGKALNEKVFGNQNK